VSRHELVMMGLLAEVEVRRDRVFKEVNEKIAAKYQQRSASSAKFQAVGDDLDDGYAEHEPGPQGDEIFQVRTVPVLLHDDGAAENVRGGSSQTEQKTEQDGMHGEWEMIAESRQLSAISSQEGCILLLRILCGIAL
jgi:hypothetical protein